MSNTEEIKETATGDLEQGEFKIKKKRGRPRKLTAKDEPVKVDLSKKEEKPAEPEVTKVEIKNEEPVVETKEEEKVEETPEVVTMEAVEETKEEVEVPEEIKEEPQQPNIDIPENVEKLINFMKETGGDITDYVRLNTDYSNVDEATLLNEYYKNTKPHLDQEEIKFLIDDAFSYDEDLEEERDIRKKKLAYKEEIAKARGFLEETKKKYYDEIKLRPGVTQEQQKAMDFFNRYNENKQRAAKQHEEFVDRTNDYFTKDFKGFEFNLGEQKFNYSINNAQDVAKNQMKIQDFVKTFLNEDGSINDHKGYHKAMYAARNADSIAKHFYEQGKADATKNIVNKSKNIETASRPQNNEDVFINGFKVRAISGVDSSKLKIQKRKFKN